MTKIDLYPIEEDVCARGNVFCSGTSEDCCFERRAGLTVRCDGINLRTFPMDSCDLHDVGRCILDHLGNKSYINIKELPTERWSPSDSGLTNLVTLLQNHGIRA